jgi:hypothetical protein
MNSSSHLTKLTLIVGFYNIVFWAFNYILIDNSKSNILEKENWALKLVENYLKTKTQLHD